MVSCQDGRKGNKKAGSGHTKALSVGRHKSSFTVPALALCCVLVKERNVLSLVGRDVMMSADLPPLFVETQDVLGFHTSLSCNL
jgi:hypothetical protein